eukprot:TRINITY_DN523_c0_g1_i3.p1 TRINITY_DN523_c0_g1~~TRINITY_DN523_c0_g1_i3.p1  ORF type:complete len:144 (-),score=18.68 TRINITY_DN523_c0_g1_i3:39-470(-)
MLVLRIVNLLLEYAALIALRLTDKRERAFSVPGGMIGVCLLPVTTILICGAEIVLGDKRVILTGVIFNAVVVMLYFIFRLVRKFKHKVQSNQRKKLGTYPEKYAGQRSLAEVINYNVQDVVIENNIVKGYDAIDSYPSPMRET